MNSVNQIFKSFNTDFIQSNCLLCGSPSEKNWCLCNPCRLELPYIEHSCKTCGSSVPLDVKRCGACIVDPPKTNQVVTILHYVSPVDYLVKKMKYHNQLEIAQLFGKLLVKQLETQQESWPDQIIPVPLHSSRLQQRGYNQAVEIARTVSKALNIPMNLTNCIRTRPTEPQFELSLDKRKTNVKNAFDIVHEIDAKHVAIIDDVMTTGSTVNELTSALLKSGIEKVDIWVCSRVTLS